LWSYATRDRQQEHFQYDITDSVLSILLAGESEGSDLLMGLVPADFRSKDSRGTVCYGCKAFYGNIGIDIEYFNYSEMP
jgi:hypothetical protein